MPAGHIDRTIGTGLLSPTTFRLQPDAFDANRRQRLRALTVRLLVMIVIVVGVGAIVLRDVPGAIGGLSLVPLTVVAVAFVVAARRQVTRWRAEWNSFEVVLTDDDLTRTIQGYPVLRIQRSEVTAIHEMPAGLSVRAGKLTALWLPRTIERYDLLRERLSTWRTPHTAVPTSRAVIWTLSALGGGWVIAMYALEHEIGRKGLEGAIPEIVLLELLALGLLVYTVRLRATLELRARRVLVKVAVLAMILPLLIVGIRKVVIPVAPNGREPAASVPAEPASPVRKE